MSKEELEQAKEAADRDYEELKARNLSLDMSRGKPAPSQIDHANGMLKEMTDYHTKAGMDVRNYGVLDGIPEMKELFSELLDIPAGQLIVGGNASLNLMFDAVMRLFVFGTMGEKPWGRLDKVKFLCPSPGYDRHFTICETLGIEMIPVPMTKEGPDMDMVEELVGSDTSIKGIWCVPKYSNPQGICYSDETVDRLASMKTAAKDFKIFWDNAYGVHPVFEDVKVKNIIDACEEAGTKNRPYYFFSTSKITFPGAGVSLIASSEENINEIKKIMGAQTIGYDKVNQLRHVQFFQNAEGLRAHMQVLAECMRPKFETVLKYLNKELAGTGLAVWEEPKGGYFVSVDVYPGCAKEVVRLAKEAGVVLTGAGATYPYKKDPKDSNLRIAPTYPTVEELEQAMELFCVCVKKAALHKLVRE
ncbi:aminotransferase class I/II-fold pyridoxal phosphate-dependent enzyme [Anaerostipes caccae]|nr:aminotransferase class I/II-fold pyridoxal phosphate-dependent enzyme [Anaerostipes caccae]MCB6293850.1 aminotransferase class I/II-fold pyridoxal phosphate-dependent enzyme [Anaerostipes caccae]MCB6371721.1 aminotransferase class I/II-fold pyridoxal phosphate-dependent enzyme [Anaerostipes caccae]MCB7186510.1 aminotransferase class I/II-fold pyridoxal phosphate-dependent enzyme [Anaerostipes caccae]MCB7187760.1 aminotransferase class I/II-fold pyridoxal phosphate-dependent enzyme [Anaerosti